MKTGLEHQVHLCPLAVDKLDVDPPGFWAQLCEGLAFGQARRSAAVQAMGSGGSAHSRASNAQNSKQAASWSGILAEETCIASSPPKLHDQYHGLPMCEHCEIRGSGHVFLPSTVMTVNIFTGEDFRIEARTHS